jgi:hypothetical protein
MPSDGPARRRSRAPVGRSGIGRPCREGPRSRACAGSPEVAGGGIGAVIAGLGFDDLLARMLARDALARRSPL